MNDEGFKDWLDNVDNRPLAQQRDNIARARRVVKGLDVNLDTEYLNGRCESVIDKLDISNVAFLRTVDLPTDKAGLSSLKSAIRKYVKYCDYLKK